jgi:two-component system, chemotaxis family, sensor kinase CheA
MDKKQLHLKLLAAFRQEAAEHVQAMSTGLLELERNPSRDRRAQCVEEMFREAHSLKGAARAVDLPQIETVCQAMESLFADVKRGKAELVAPLIDALHEAVDLLARAIPPPGAESQARDWTGVQHVIARLQSIGEDNIDETGHEPRVHEAEEAPAVSAVAELLATGTTVRIATEKLESIAFRAEEMRAAKLAAMAHSAELRAAVRETTAMKPKLAELAAQAERHHRALAASVDGLLEDVKTMLTLPVASAVDLLPKMVRDLSREQGKQVHLNLVGTEIEIDRRILQDLREPLMHLVRNAIDHGIESPQVRQRAGKPAVGTIDVAFRQQGGSRMEIEIRDDGAGIDVQRLREAAQVADTISQDGGRGEGLELVFKSGVSTAPQVTRLSGRGLGLAIVRDKVERLGGIVSIESQPGEGVTLRMDVPLSLASFRGVLVRVANCPMFLPTTHVAQAFRIGEDAVQRIENRDTLAWQGAVVPLVDLAAVLELPPAEQSVDSRAVHAVLLQAAGQRIAFRVDSVIGEQEVMARSLGPLLTGVKHIAGATLLGEGELVPILHVPDLMRSANRDGAHASRAAAPAPKLSQRKSILVAEDSITSRMLLQNILEAAGYKVQTAVDGVEALTWLKSEAFDAVVSDVEMPRMNGFDLTARLRADKDLASTPVVLVTALESSLDRERGVDVGADAYIVKSSFDQSNLLEVLERLL